MFAHRTLADLEAAGLRLLLGHDAVAIDLKRRKVTVQPSTGTAFELAYDAVVIGTGATPVRPNLPGVDLPGVHLLHTIDEARQLRNVIDEGARRVALIGAGYVGTEMADAFAHRNVEVTIVEMAPSVLTTFDPDLGRRVGAELEDHGVTVVCGTTVERIEPAAGGGLRVIGSPALDVTADAVLVAVGVRPDSTLARTAGVEVDRRGAITVDSTMATNVEGIWAAGDCVHTHHLLYPEPVYLPLGTTAHKQGRVAGINAAGGHTTFAGSLGTQAVKILGLVAARTGLAKPKPLAPVSTRSASPSPSTTTRPIILARPPCTFDSPATAKAAGCSAPKSSGRTAPRSPREWTSSPQRFTPAPPSTN